MSSGGRKPLMGGNWKLNPKSVQESINLATDVAKLTKGVTSVDIALFPPHPFLVPVFTKVEASNVKLGAQDCFFESEGAYTGAVSTCMLKDIGVTYILCGHSERRTLFGDDDFAINRKVKKILKEGLLPVLCCGETQEEYEAGLNHEVCACQLLKDLSDISAEDMAKIVIAYEPVWAIGTGLVCPADVAQEVHAFIRSVIAKKYGKDVADKVIIQYGGSVKPDNVKEIMSKPDIDGCLVGGASLNAASFAKIVNFKDQ
jgi:triosephosphate isomerase